MLGALADGTGGAAPEGAAGMLGVRLEGSCGAFPAGIAGGIPGTGGAPELFTVCGSCSLETFLNVGIPPARISPN